MSLREKIEKGITDCALTFPFLSYILERTYIMEAKSMPAIMGVTWSYKGVILLYNPVYVDTLEDDMKKAFMDQRLINYVLLHEASHIIHHHGESNLLNKVMMNLATDAIINHYLDIITKSHSQFNRLNTGVTLDEGYEGEKNHLAYYKYLLKKYKDEINMREKIEQMIEKLFDLHEVGSSELNPDDINSGMNKLLKESGIQPEEVDDSFKQDVISSMITSCKNRGIISKNEQKLLDSIVVKKKIDFSKLIRRTLGNFVGLEKEETWAKLNRKRLPLKGYRKTRGVFNVLYDTSGSMCDEHQVALGYLFRNDIAFRLIQIDNEVRESKLIQSKTALQNTIIKGNGGTVLQPGIDYIANKYPKTPLLVITDGYTDKLNFEGIQNNVLAVSVGRKIPVKGNKQITQIVIPKEGKNE